VDLGDEHLADQLLLVLSQGLSSDDFGLLGLEFDVCVIMDVGMLLGLVLLGMMVGGDIFDVLVLSFVGMHFG
jgi:hypothetical protein